MHASMHASVLYETDTDSQGTSNSPSYSLSAAWALATARPASPVYNPTQSIRPDTSGNSGVFGSPPVQQATLPFSRVHSPVLATLTAPQF